MSKVVNEVIQSLWIGPRLSSMERLSLESFLRLGHEVHLYTYGHVDGIPAGTVVRDAGEILPEERIFVYREHQSYSGFSNFFRYKLLLERGGWWVDTDVVALAPFDLEGAHVFASELSKGVQYVTSAVIKAPRGSEAMGRAWETCAARDPAALRWGETGPALLAAVVEELSLQSCVQLPQLFCPIGYSDWRRLLDADPPDLPAESVAVHLWNEMWRRDGRDKDAPADPCSLYERLKREMRCAAESAPAG